MCITVVKILYDTHSLYAGMDARAKSFGIGANFRDSTLNAIVCFGFATSV